MSRVVVPGAGIAGHTAASPTVFPIVPDCSRRPETGREPDATFGEIGLAAQWIKILPHHMFLYEARLRPGWWLVQEQRRPAPVALPRALAVAPSRPALRLGDGEWPRRGAQEASGGLAVSCSGSSVGSGCGTA
jgi:hypothetical protein